MFSDTRYPNEHFTNIMLEIFGESVATCYGLLAYKQGKRFDRVVTNKNETPI